MGKNRNKHQVKEDQVDEQEDEQDIEDGEEVLEGDADEPDAVVYPANVFTYVGGGTDSPQVINFMGKQKFVRGQLTEVTDPEVLAKIKYNPSFINGEVSQEELYEMDKDAVKKAEHRRKLDAIANAQFKKKHVVE